jgi:hypothetical protein
MLGIVKRFLYLSMLVLASSVLFACYRQYKFEKLSVDISLWAERTKIVIDKSIKPIPFKVEFDQKEWELLLRKLRLTKYFEPLDRKSVPAFDYGFNSDYSKELVDYWQTKFNWSAQVDLLNKYPQFRINFNGIKIHYVRFKTNAQSGLKSTPVLLLDGWPGSFFGFYKLLDYVNENYKDLSLGMFFFIQTIVNFSRD